MHESASLGHAGRQGVLALFTSVLTLATIATPTAAQNPVWPSGRARHHMVYDSAMQQVLMLGGAQPRQAGSSADSAIWSWNGSRWRPHASSLPLRANDAMTFDTRRGRLIVHGGSDRPDATWEWDRHTWQLVNAAGPGARAHHALLYDPSRTQTILFGHNDNTPLTDTWAWDGRAWKSAASDGPPARGVYGIAYDTHRRVAVLFGGCCARGFRDDTWEWDGTRWTQITTTAGPTPRYDTGLAYDPIRRRMVLFGGRTRDGNVSDTWEYDGRTWTRLDVPGPSPRNGHAMVYDPRAKAILLFGGRNEPAYLNDLWAFDGTWKQINSR